VHPEAVNGAYVEHKKEGSVELGISTPALSGVVEVQVQALLL